MSFPPRAIFAGVVWGFAALPAVFATPPAVARTVYVRASGDDANDGAMPATAVRTIGRGASVAVAGDSVIVGPGTYVEGDIRPAAFGQVRFIGDRRGSATGDPPGDVVIDATGFGTGFELNHQLAMAIDGFVIYGAVIGIYVKSQSHQAIVSNNVVCNQRDNGIYIQDSRDVVIFNNLVYSNGQAGILVTGNTDGSPGAVIVNNTVYRNAARGIFFAGTDHSSPRGVVLNNVVQDNGIAGIQVNETSQVDYVSAGNVSFGNRFASGTPIDVMDIGADPLFVDPDGRDGILGGVGYADDDFRLSQARAGQDVTSPAVDAGSDSSRGMGLDGSSTRTDGRPDRGIVDAGYHYGNFEPPPAQPTQRLRNKPLYVSPADGSDLNDGATRDAAFKTLKYALTKARPGHRVVLGGGTYQEGVITMEASGKPGRPLIVQAVDGAVIDAAGAKEGLVLNSVHDVVLDGLRVTGASEDGIAVRDFLDVSRPGVPSIWLRRCQLFGNGTRGLHIRHRTSVLLTSCTVENNGARGIQIDTGSLRVERSVIRSNGLTGLWAFGGSSVFLLDTDVIDNVDDGVLVEEADVTIVGGKVTGSIDGGVRLRDGSTGMLEDVVIADNTDLGVQTISSLVTLIGGRIENNGVGVQAFASDVHPSPVEVAVDGTTISRNRLSGIDAQETTLSVVAATIAANGRDGIRLRGGSLDVVGSSFTDNFDGGMAVSGVSSTALRQVVAEGNGDSGAQLDNAASVLVESSSFLANRGDGLTINALNSPPIIECVGDCGGDGQVSVDEVVIGVNIALGVASVSTCTALDANDDGAVSVDEITTAGNNALNGCPSGTGATPASPSTVELDDIVACQNTGAGLDLRRASVLLTGATACFNGRDGLRFKDGSLDVAESSFTDNVDGGIAVSGASSTALREVVAEGNGESGAQLDNAASIVVESSSFLANRGDGLTINASNDPPTDGAGATPASPSSVEANDIVVCQNTGSGLDVQRASVLLAGATACFNGRDGLRFKEGAVDVSASSFTDNLDGGIAVTDSERTSLQDVVVGRNRDNGAQVARAGTLSVLDSSFFDNTGDGLTIIDSAGAEVSNNLIYRNGSSGVAISGEALGSDSPRLTSNTFYGNTNRGLFILDAPNGRVTRNIFRGNGTAGVQASGASATGYVGDYNLNTDPYGFQTPVGANDIFADPLMVDPEGGDFHLSHRAAGQGASSPAIDAGDTSASSVGMGAKTTRTDGVADTGLVDLGYHYVP